MLIKLRQFVDDKIYIINWCWYRGQLCNHSHTMVDKIDIARVRVLHNFKISSVWWECARRRLWIWYSTLKVYGRLGIMRLLIFGWMYEYASKYSANFMKKIQFNFLVSSDVWYIYLYLLWSRSMHTIHTFHQLKAKTKNRLCGSYNLIKNNLHI